MTPEPTPESLAEFAKSLGFPSILEALESIGAPDSITRPGQLTRAEIDRLTSTSPPTADSADKWTMQPPPADWQASPIAGIDPADMAAWKPAADTAALVEEINNYIEAWLNAEPMAAHGLAAFMAGAKDRILAALSRPSSEAQAWQDGAKAMQGKVIFMAGHSITADRIRTIDPTTLRKDR